MKWVYSFGNGEADGDGKMKTLLGGKGAGLAEMTRLGLPVPPGFTLVTDACNYWFKNGEGYPDGMWSEVATALALAEARMGRRFGDAHNPLLFSVRSGAPQSMPGGIETVTSAVSRSSLLKPSTSLPTSRQIGHWGSNSKRFMAASPVSSATI